MPTLCSQEWIKEKDSHVGIFAKDWLGVGPPGGPAVWVRSWGSLLCDGIDGVRFYVLAFFWGSEEAASWS